MPKVIPELREALLTAARRRLVESDQHDLTMRQIAADCGVAVGTAYNYFPSKEYLLAGLMLEDWQETCGSLESIAGSADAAVEGLRAMERALRSFVEKYSPTWRNYTGRARDPGPIGERHSQLIGQIGAAVAALLERQGKALYSGETEVLSEMLLTLSQRETGAFDRILPVIEKIIA